MNVNEAIITTTKIISEPINLLILVFLIMIITGVIFDLNYFNCGVMIKKYFDCFKTKNDTRYNKGAIAIAFLIPMVLSYATLKVRTLDGSLIEVITVIISILTSMLFTLLTIIIDIKAKYEDKFFSKKANASDISKIDSLISKIYASIMFEILISISILLMCFVGMFANSFTQLSSLVTYYLTYVLVINLFMLLKRVFIIVQEELR